MGNNETGLKFDTVNGDSALNSGITFANLNNCGNTPSSIEWLKSIDKFEVIDGLACLTNFVVISNISAAFESFKSKW